MLCKPQITVSARTHTVHPRHCSPAGFLHRRQRHTAAAPCPRRRGARHCRADDGDEAARRLLIEHNLRLVVYISKRFENTGINIEDLISIGTIGLIKAVNTFNSSKNIKLATYASRCIENEILMYLRKISSQRTEISFDEPLNTDWDGEKEVADMLGISQSYISRLEKADH